jgi:hypothetical protein
VWTHKKKGRRPVLSPRRCFVVFHAVDDVPHTARCLEPGVCSLEGKKSSFLGCGKQDF